MKVLLTLMSLGCLANCARILQYAIFHLLPQRNEVVVYNAYALPYSVANLTHIDLPTSLTELRTVSENVSGIALTNVFVRSEPVRSSPGFFAD
ncbi:hypothetical protein J6590_010001 [Homalodisca vitripennis]|nr:hypothetical protein J6590_010001 [Homalodisca vitripennis]